MKTSIWNLALSLSLAASACAVLEDAGPEPESEDPPELGTAEIGKEMQGQFALGELMDGLPGTDANHRFSVSRFSGAIEVAKFVGSASLDVRTGTLNGPNGYKLTFTRVGPQRDVSSYTLSLLVPGTPDPIDPCDGGTAMPFLGTFTRDRAHEYDPLRVSFSCVTGTASKCVNFGYLPGSVPSSVPKWQAHEACMQMASAAYCADDESYTLEETTIAIADFVGIRGEPPADIENATDWPPPPTDFSYEGAYLTGHQKVFCLARARWSELPLGGPNGCGLDDPRLGVGNYCEEYDWDGDRETGHGTLEPPADVIIVNASAHNVLGYHLWRSGNDFVGTVRGYADGGGRPDLAPFPTGTWDHVGLDAVLLRRPTPSMNVTAARTYVGPNNDRVLGPDPAPAGWPMGYNPPAVASQEGFLFTDDTWDGTVPLYLYSRTVNNQTEYASATEPPSAAHSLAISDPLGWVFEAKQ